MSTDERRPSASKVRADEDEEAAPEELVVIPITGELDLHAFAPRDVPAVVADYVAACREAGLREVRLIHGRGKGVQRAAVRRVLARLPGIGEVRDAPPGSGGWGATLARLHVEDARDER